MSNNILTISMITQEALMVLENELTFSKGVYREYDDAFARTGAKIGNTLNVRRPARFLGTSGPNLNVEDFYEGSTPVTLGNSASNPNPYGDQFHVDTQFTTQDLTLSMDRFSDRLIKPAMAAIANRVDYLGLLMAKNSTANIVGTPGTIASSLRTYLDAQAYLDSEAAPRDGFRSVCIEPFTSSAIIDSLKGLFMPQSNISEQYRKGLMGRDSAGLDWKLDQNVISHTFGSWSGAGSTVSANTTGAFTGSISSGWQSTSTITLTTAAQTLSLKQGDTITIANVFAVNPQNRQSYGKLRSFVVTSDVAVGTGGASVTVSPAIITAGQFQNVVVAATSATAAVTPLNAGTTSVASAVSPQNILMHRNAFTLATADLEMPEGVHFAGRAASKESGLSVRIVRQYTINNDAIPTRMDVLFGWAPLYIELACRVAS
jgi:hypothetical protein